MRAFLRNLVFGDWLLKFFSIALAILTWLAVSFSLQQKPVAVSGKPDLSERPFFDVPVTIVSSDSDVHGFKVKPSEVNLIVRGASNLLESLTRENVRVQVDLTATEVIPGMKRSLGAITPAGVAPMVIEPEQVEIILPPAPEPKPTAK
jgi:YbbR domain-containing protein